MSFDNLPGYYSSLEPFREFFDTGAPILMYHKIAPRAPGARCKGLYMDPETFSKQLEELHAAGFQSPPLSKVALAAKPNSRQIILTFDDGFRNVFDNAVEILQKHQMRGVLFVVANFMGRDNEWDLREGEVREPLMDEGQIRAWLAAGHEIGSHTLTHARLGRLSMRDAEEEILVSKQRLQDQFGVPVDHFCYPYGEWNDKVRNLVCEAGYKTACTADFGVNQAETSPFSLKRIPARYRTRNLRNMALTITEMTNKVINGAGKCW